MLRDYNSEQTFLDDLYTAHLDGDCDAFLGDYAGQCTYCQAERDRQAFEARQAQERGHDYSMSDHCSRCGAEMFESEAYYLPCDRSFENV